MNFVTWKIEGGTRDFRVLKRFIYKRKDYEMNDILGKSRQFVQGIALFQAMLPDLVSQ